MQMVVHTRREMSLFCYAKYMANCCVHESRVFKFNFIQIYPTITITSKEFPLFTFHYCCASVSLKFTPLYFNVPYLWVVRTTFAGYSMCLREM